MKRAVLAVATALLVVTAGCAGMAGTATPGGDGGAAGDGASGGEDASAGDAGAVNFYVSDQPNDMDDFAHLNVTITTVRFRLVDAAGNGSTDAAGNASTVTPANATMTPNATATATPANGTETEADDKDEREEDDDEREDEEKDEESEDGDGRWVTREVNATSVDLSQLRGANATLLEQFDLPAGEYDTVHMEVGEVEGTLTNGDDQRVKLPSGKLQLDTEFTVENGSEVDFVYDVSVHKAGNSGKYILKPVVSESGTEVPIERVDDEDDDDRSIDASFVGDVSAGENVTVRVTENGSALANATVGVDDGPTGTTDADGEYVASVPSDAEELEIEVEDGDAEAELEAEFEEEDDDDDEDGDGEDD